jgi:hypothetical protein
MHPLKIEEEDAGVVGTFFLEIEEGLPVEGKLHLWGFCKVKHSGI